MFPTIDLSKLVKGSGVLHTKYKDINVRESVKLLIFISTIKHVREESGNLILKIPQISEYYTTYRLTEVEKQLLIDFILMERKAHNTPRPSQTASILKHAGFA